jgi:uncharacterized protein (DUF1697 family)
MKQYVAFLRGINVNGIKVDMKELVKLFEKIGYKNVKTYLNTGNVRFDTNDPIELVKIKTESQLSIHFKYEAYVVVFNAEDIKVIVDQYPFDRGKEAHAYAILIDDEIVKEELLDVTNKFLESSEKAQGGDQVIFWQCPKGKTTETQFARILNKIKYRYNTTTRNINTLEKMIK